MHDGLENPNFQHVYIQLTPNSLRGSKGILYFIFIYYNKFNNKKKL